MKPMDAYRFGMNFSGRRVSAARRVAHVALMAAVVVAAAGCGTFRRFSYPWKPTYMPISSKNTGFTKTYPNSFTIYPFKNITWYRDAAGRARRAAFEKFSLIGPCARMEETDKLASIPYSYEDAIKVARKRGSDAVVIGEALTQENSFLFLYAYNYVEMKITVYETKTGAPLWTGTGWSMSNEFGGLIFWIPNPIIPMLENVFWSRRASDLYHRIMMDVVANMRPDVLELDPPATGGGE